jgi:O-antigen/teichoic acid export membrane protein
MVHHAGHYLTGRVGLMLLGFASFPLLTRLLSVQQYGELSLLLKIALLCTVLGKCGLQNAAIRFLPECEADHQDRRQVCIATLIATSAFMAFVIALLTWMILHLNIWNLSSKVVGLVNIALILVFIRSIQPTLSGLLRAERRTILFNVCELLGKSLGIGFSVGALLWVTLDLRYYIAGLVIAEASVISGILIWYAQQGCLKISKIDFTFARRSLLFSVPLIAYELASVVLDSGDRILISHYLGLEQLGYYSAAYSIATYAEQVILMPINLAIFPIYMKIWVEKGEFATAEFLSKALDLFIIFASGVSVLVLLTSHDLVMVLASKKFETAHTLLPVLVAGLLIYAVHIFFNAPLLIFNRSFVLAAVTSICCLVNIGINMVLLPILGIMGAAIATLVSYICLVVGMAVVSRRYLTFPIPVRHVLTSIALIPFVYFACHAIAASGPILNIVCKSSLSFVLFSAGILLLRPDLRTKIFNRYRSRIKEESSSLAA